MVTSLPMGVALRVVSDHHGAPITAIDIRQGLVQVRERKRERERERERGGGGGGES